MGRHTPEAALRRRLDEAESTVASLKDELANLDAQVDVAVTAIRDHAGSVDAEAAARVAGATQRLSDALAGVGGGPGADPTQAEPPPSVPETPSSASWPLS